jgi:GTP cyclohydrolase I
MCTPERGGQYPMGSRRGREGKQKMKTVVKPTEKATSSTGIDAAIRELLDCLHHQITVEGLSEEAKNIKEAFEDAMKAHFDRVIHFFLGEVIHLGYFDTETDETSELVSNLVNHFYFMSIGQ